MIFQNFQAKEKARVYLIADLIIKLYVDVILKL